MRNNYHVRDDPVQDGLAGDPLGDSVQGLQRSELGGAELQGSHVGGDEGDDQAETVGIESGTIFWRDLFFFMFPVGRFRLLLLLLGESAGLERLVQHLENAAHVLVNSGKWRRNQSVFVEKTDEDIVKQIRKATNKSLRCAVLQTTRKFPHSV